MLKQNTGSTGLSFLQTLVIADITPLQSRGLAYGAVSFVYLPFALIAPNIASGVGLEHWRWGYGMFCIHKPFCLVPLLVLLFWTEAHMRKTNPPSSTEDSMTGSRSRRWAQAFWLTDPLGLVLVGTAFSLLLCPPTLYAGAIGGWHNPSMIAMEVVGGVVFVLLLFWEWKVAPHPFIPRRVFNRNFSLCLFTTIIYFLAVNVYNTYWSSWLFVVQDYSQRKWTYISETGTAALCVFSLIAGLIIRYTHRYKVLQITGVVISCVGAGVNYYSASPGHTSTVAVVFAQLLIQGGSAFALIAAQTALQGSTKPEDLAIAIAIYICSESLGGGIGAAIAGSIWSNDLVAYLVEYAPTLNATEIISVAGDITIARLSEPRQGIIEAYDRTFRKIALVSLVLIFLPLVSTSLNREYFMDTRQNTVEEKHEDDDKRREEGV